MALRTNTAEGGTNNTTVSTGNSGGASGDAFSNVEIGAGASLVYSNERPQHGALGYKFTGSSGTVTRLTWSGFNTTAFVFRIYFEFDTLPPSGFRLIDVRNNTASGLRVVLNGSNQPVLQTNNGGTTLKTFTTAIAADTKYRIEVAATPGNASNATIKMDLYLGDSTTPVETGYSSTTVTTGYTTNITNVQFISAAGSTFTGVAYFDDFAAQDGTTTYIGPITVVANAGVDLTGILPGSLVYLDGSASEGSSANWEQSFGVPGVTIINENEFIASYIAPATLTGTTLEFEVTIDATDSDIVSHSIAPTNLRVYNGDEWVAAYIRTVE